MDNNHLKFVIVGHVDHGKSTLIGRLLFDTGFISDEKIEDVKQICESLGKPFEFAFLMDHLTEEREKNITIDTAQTFFKTPKRDYVIIDAPGHKEFLKNMITGTTLAEAAILIIDAGEGIQEQTKRHAYLLSLLGVKQLIIVINKMDKINYEEQRFNQVKNDLNNHLEKIGLIPNYIIPISAKDGDNVAKKSDKLNWFSGPTVLDALDSFEPLPDASDKPLRMPVQDLATPTTEHIPVGQIESGKIQVGQKITVLPKQEIFTVTKIMKWLQELSEATAGHNIGIFFKEPFDINRGDIICDTNNLPKVTNEFKATIFWMAKTGLNAGEEFKLKLTTQETTAHIKEIHKLINSSTLEEIKNSSKINETEVAEVTIKADKKMVIENFNFIPELGRFVLVKDDDIVAGGIIT